MIKCHMQAVFVKDLNIWRKRFLMGMIRKGYEEQ